MPAAAAAGHGMVSWHKLCWHVGNWRLKAVGGRWFATFSIRVLSFVLSHVRVLLTRMLPCISCGCFYDSLLKRHGRRCAGVDLGLSQRLSRGAIADISRQPGRSLLERNAQVPSGAACIPCTCCLQTCNSWDMVLSSGLQALHGTRWTVKWTM